ncbi:MAG TPA: NAD-dependent epimerase/dehydratase family protein [Candidatus Acidoferrales bacterium]|nr:NAD-dependent epimerase/dehydratase family protein [Candidatus Acidoferrales bacterium]
MTHRIFVTGATGYVGSAVAARLARAGHEVHGLTRRAEHARLLESIGVQPVVGDLADCEPWIGLLQNCDVAVHAAFDAETGASEQDHNALEALRVAALDGRVRRVLYTSGIWVHGPGDEKPLDETSPLKPLELVQWRVAHEEIATDLSVHDVTAVVLRPGMVYGENRGVLGAWFAEAHAKKTLTYPGDGAQRWPMAHRDDVADAYLLALEHGGHGERYLLADESRHTVRQLAEAAAAASGATPRSWPAHELVAALGLYGKALLNDATVTSAKARRELGWVPRHASFVAEAPQLWREWLEGRAATVA